MILLGPAISMAVLFEVVPAGLGRQWWDALATPAVGLDQRVEVSAVGAEGDPAHATEDAGIRSQGSTGGLARRRVPEPHGAIAVGAGEQLSVRAECDSVHAGRISGQAAGLLLVHQQACQQRLGLACREDAPRSDGQAACGIRAGGTDGDAIGRELARESYRMLARGCGGVVRSEPSCRAGRHCKGGQASDDNPGAPARPASCVLGGPEEGCRDRRQRRVAARQSRPPAPGRGDHAESARTVQKDDLTGISLRGARANAFTEWPDGFDWRQAGVIMDDEP
jgi:hypothetical protein